MLYRKFPAIPDIEVSALGLGCMRLPTTPDGSAIDEAAANAVLTLALDSGINYIDTAWPYHKGESEPWLGKALADLGARDRVYLATKAPTWLVKGKADWESYLSRQLERLRTDHIDFYLVHALNAARWKTVLETDGLAFLEKARADGRIGHIGFSFHDSLDAFKTIVDGYRGWEFCQVQYNYIDEETQAGSEGIAYAASRGLGVIVMEPLRGGALASGPAEVLSAFAAYGKPRTPAEWALRHVLDRQEVVTALSGMGALSQVAENAGVASSACPNSMTADERSVVAAARSAFTARMAVPCTACGYCQPCPSGVAISDCFGLWNEGLMFDTLAKSQRQYAEGPAAGGHGAAACVECGACLPKCPQGIDIPKRLKDADAALSS